MDVACAMVVVPLLSDVVVVLSSADVVVVTSPGSPAWVPQAPSTRTRTPLSATERIEALM